MTPDRWKQRHSQLTGQRNSLFRRLRLVQQSLCFTFHNPADEKRRLLAKLRGVNHELGVLEVDARKHGVSVI